MNTIRDTGFVLKEGARLLTELKRLHDRLHSGAINRDQATQEGLSQIQASREAIASASPVSASASTLPTDLEQKEVVQSSFKEVLNHEKADALAAYTGVSAINPASAFLASEVISINYLNAMAGKNLRPDLTAKATECFNKAVAGDLNAGLEFLQTKHRGESATQDIVKTLGRSIGKDTTKLNDRNAEILKKKATDFLHGKSTAPRFRAEISRMCNPISQKM